MSIQVLVPLLSRIRKATTSPGLTQADFKIFEDGVEQKITAFSVESSGLTGTPFLAPKTIAPKRPAARCATECRTVAPAARTPVRRTYLICIDTMHASFNNLRVGREALVKLFQQEHSRRFPICRDCARRVGGSGPERDARSRRRARGFPEQKIPEDLPRRPDGRSLGRNGKDTAGI